MSVQEGLFMVVFMYKSETMLWKEKENIIGLEMDSFGGLLGIRRIVRNVLVRPCWKKWRVIQLPIRYR